jgi:NAD(P)-dependent dehydrogenase (short-subunit alcohol dehydrogenase family)
LVFWIRADENPAAVEEDMLQCFRVNVVGQVFLFRAFLPLVKAGSLKKIIGISTGYADIELNADYDLYQAAPYSISKVAFNMAITKIQAEHRKDGVLLMSVSPGVVDTGHAPTPDKGEKAMILGQKFGRYAPDFKGPITPAESAALVLDVIDKATLEASGGRHVSQFGNTRWL